MNNENNDAVDQQIEQMISSEDSVVGIDAKKNAYYHHPEIDEHRKPAASY